MLKIKKILVATDFSESAHRALAHALHLAHRFGSEVHLLYVTRQGAPDTGDALKDPLKEQVNLAGVLYSAAGRGANPEARKPQRLHTVPVQRVADAPAAGILTYAAEQDMDLIAMGTQGRRGLDRLLIGSTAAEVIRRATCPVLTVRSGKTSVPGQGIQHILVPVDFSAASRPLVRHAKELASLYGADLDLLHVVERPGLPEFYKLDRFAAAVPKLGTFYREQLEKLAEEAVGPEVPTRFHVLVGDPASDILRFASAQETDLLLIATYGQSGFKQVLLGSVAEQVIRAAPCLVVTMSSSAKSLVVSPRKTERLLST